MLPSEPAGGEIPIAKEVPGRRWGKGTEQGYEGN